VNVTLVGFSGYARSGKDTAADSLSSLNFRRISFADKLREFVYEINPIIVSDGSYARLREVIDKYGWDGYKETAWATEIRHNLQVVGTECGRNMISQNIWVDATLNNLGPGNYAISDVRYPNEIDAIRSKGGKVYRILRNGVEPANLHSSETSLDGYDFDGYIHNDGSLSEFRCSVRRRVLESLVSVD